MTKIRCRRHTRTLAHIQTTNDRQRTKYSKRTNYNSSLRGCVCVSRETRAQTTNESSVRAFPSTVRLDSEEEGEVTADDCRRRVVLLRVVVSSLRARAISFSLTLLWRSSAAVAAATAAANYRLPLRRTITASTFLGRRLSSIIVRSCTLFFSLYFLH